MIRKARISDAESIYKLVASYSQKGVMLSRSLNSIYEHIRDFWVVEDDQSHELIGCAALQIIGWDGLAEVRSLVISSSKQNMGLGKKLIDTCINEANEMNVKRLFALTFVPGFFIKCGFYEISKDKLPHKIWSDCIDCPMFPDCKEIAVIIDLN